MIPSDQEIVDAFALLIIGQASLIEGDPRVPLVTIASICLENFVQLTRYAYENGLLQDVPENGFKPQFVRPEDNE